MKTIEERAIQASSQYDDQAYSAGLYMGYKEGAEEQKQIDRELFEKWYCKKKCYRRKECQIPTIMCYRLGQIVKDIENI